MKLSENEQLEWPYTRKFLGCNIFAARGCFFPTPSPVQSRLYVCVHLERYQIASGPWTAGERSKRATFRRERERGRKRRNKTKLARQGRREKEREGEIVFFLSLAS